MNMQRRSNRRVSQSVSNDRRQGYQSQDAEMLPWADPYILGLMREHERQMRGFERASNRSE